MVEALPQKSRLTILPTATKEDMIRQEAVVDTLKGYRSSGNNPIDFPTIFAEKVTEKMSRIRDTLDRYVDAEIADTCDEYIDPLDCSDIFSTFPYTLTEDPITLVSETEAQEIYSMIHTTIRPKPKE